MAEFRSHDPRLARTHDQRPVIPLSFCVADNEEKGGHDVIHA